MVAPPHNFDVGHHVAEVKMAQYAELSQVETLYAETSYGGGINEKDTVFVAKTNGVIVGAVRLCLEEGVIVLRGMQISKAFQRHGIGAQLLAACTSHLDQKLSFCLPYLHLKEFYGSASFEVAPLNELPEFLAKRLSSYLTRGQDVIAMRRITPNHSIERTLKI